MNVNCLDINTPFSLIKLFGFNSGKTVDKFKDYTDVTRCENGLLRLNKHINAYFSLIVEDYVDLGTHGMFICEISDAKTLSDSESLTYDYYYKHIKPSVNTEGKKDGYVRYVVISMREKNYHLTLFVHYVSTVSLISKTLDDEDNFIVFICLSNI